MAIKKLGKLKYLISFFCCYVSYVQGHPYDAIINLGGDCQVAYQLKKNELRKYALPFDVLMTSWCSLKSVLENDFKGLFNIKNFQLSIGEDGVTCIRDIKYGMRFLHDFPINTDFLERYPEIAIKYEERIRRFNWLVSYSSHPLFIRKGINQHQAIELRDLLTFKRKGKPFLLVALDSTEEMRSDWGLEYISNYYLKSDTCSWKGDDEAWQEIFLCLQLL